MSRLKGMINVEAIDATRRLFATAGAELAEEAAVFLPAEWPPHRYDALAAPNGAFIESTVDRSAPHYPGQEVRVPDWTDAGSSYGFAQAEADKVGLFLIWLFTRKGQPWLSDYFAAEASDVFVRFGVRGDRSFEGGKFPRDQWKAGSFDVERWETIRFAIGAAASVIMEEIDRINYENTVLAQRSWIITKFVSGDVVGSPGLHDTTFAAMPELMEDVEPSYTDFPAYIRVSDIVNSSDASWTGSGASFARAANSYGLLFGQLSSGAFAQDFFDSCFTLWRTGSQTRRRDQNEEDQ